MRLFSLRTTKLNYRDYILQRDADQDSRCSITDIRDLDGHSQNVKIQVLQIRAVSCFVTSMRFSNSVIELL